MGALQEIKRRHLKMFYNCIQKILKTKQNVTNKELYFQIKIGIVQSNN